MEALGYVCLLIMGITLSLIGAGGSILTIPILIYLFKVPLMIATTYSLIIVGSSALIASWRYRSLILFKKAILFGLPSSLAMFIARYSIIPNLPPLIGMFSTNDIILTLFILFMLLAAYCMIQANMIGNWALFAEKTKSLHINITIIAFTLGLLMGIIGSGGGFLIVPFFIIFMQLTIKNAIPNSLFVITMNSFIGFLSDKHHLYMDDWMNLLKYFSFAFIGILFGIFLARFIQGENLKKVFGYFILSLAILISAKEFFL